HLQGRLGTLHSERDLDRRVRRAVFACVVQEVVQNQCDPLWVSAHVHSGARPVEADARGSPCSWLAIAPATASTRSKATTVRLSAFDESRAWFSSCAISRAIRSICAMALSIAPRSRAGSWPMKRR